MNTDRLKLVVFFILAFSPALVFSWWGPTAEHAFAAILCFMLLWYLFWALFFFVELTPVESVTYLVRMAQAAILAASFMSTCVLLILNASLRTCLYINAFLYASFALATCGILLHYAELINIVKGEEKK